MRLTADLIAKQPQFINPLKERELDLRGAPRPRSNMACEIGLSMRARCMSPLPTHELRVPPRGRRPAHSGD